MDEWQYEQAERFDREAKERELAAIRKENEPQTDDSFDGIHCIGCGEEIVPARLSMGKIRCTDCQSVYEVRRARDGKG